MKIVVDYREHDLYDVLIDKTMTLGDGIIVKENLLLGDIQIQKEYGEQMIIFERKTVKDLLASIKDGRYSEQSYRLTHSCDVHNHNIVYIIEGNLYHGIADIEKRIALNAFISLMIFKGFSVLNTQSVTETGNMIVSIMLKVEKEYAKNKIPYYYCSKDNNTQPQVKASTETDYVDVVKKTKKDNITKNNIGNIMLCQIPGISASISKVILNDFNSFREFLDELKENPDFLNTLVIQSPNGKTRKISKTIIENIKNYLL